ncbi:hypothetical protein QZM76_14055 [Burkholderia multivorans]|nr:hypothetical protein [Burkholderia multivorans]
MEKLDELLREYAQSIHRDDGTAFVHADAIRRLFQDRAAASPAAEAARLTDEQRRVLVEVAQTFKGTDRRRAVLNELAGVAAPQPAQADAPAEAREPHSDDVAVDSFAAAMKHKLALARAKGRGGWETCSPADLSRMLREHVAKGDPRDVANFCMMLWHHGSPIVSAPADTGEVVAWRSWKDGDGYGFWDTRDEAELASAHDFEPEPLYTLKGQT